MRYMREVGPIPEVQSGETREEFVDRCIPIVIEDGTADTPEQAVAICNSMWEAAKKSVYKGLIFKTK